MKNVAAAFLFSICLAVSGIEASRANDGIQLFQWMSGCWSGEGQRNSKVSDRVSRITARACATCSASRLDSHNEIRDEGLGKDYLTDYWVMPAEGSTTQFQLGKGGVKRSASNGIFDPLLKQFQSTQDLGGGYRIVSRTEFDPEAGRSVYTEQGYREATELYETRIEYTRVTEARCSE